MGSIWDRPPAISLFSPLPTLTPGSWCPVLNAVEAFYVYPPEPSVYSILGEQVDIGQYGGYPARLAFSRAAQSLSSSSFIHNAQAVCHLLGVVFAHDLFIDDQAEHLYR